MNDIIVLGAGMVGSVMAADLKEKFNVTVADKDTDRLNSVRNKYSVNTVVADFSDLDSITALVRNYDFVVGAVPGFLGFKVLEAVIKAKKDIVDISFFPEDCFLLDELAKKNGVTAIVDCGVAPGMSNFILGHHKKSMKIENFRCLVGGLPVIREMPFQYKAPFSPVDVIEEYTRPARYVENGHIVVKPALSDPEYVFFEEVGTLEAFNSDGLRSLIKTIEAPNMIEKTMRYPGHIRLISDLKDAGFFATEPLKIAGSEISPLEFTSKILFDKWKLQPDDEEFTIMRINVGGTENGKPVEYVYNLYDKYDRQSGFSSMARTTGFTATAAVNLINEGRFDDKGVFPPEFVGEKSGTLDYVLNYLNQRNVIYRVERR